MHFVEHNVSKQLESLVIMLPIISLYVQLRLAYLFKWMNIFRFYVIVIYFGTRSYLLLLNARSWQKIDNKKVRSLALNFDGICYAAKVTKQSPSRITNTCLHFYGIRLKSTCSFLQASSTIAYKDDSWLRLLSYFFSLFCHIINFLFLMVVVIIVIDIDVCGDSVTLVSLSLGSVFSRILILVLDLKLSKIKPEMQTCSRLMRTKEIETDFRQKVNLASIYLTKPKIERKLFTMSGQSHFLKSAFIHSEVTSAFPLHS